MSEGLTDTRWTREEWLADANAWIAEQIAALGARPAGEITQPHVRPWATAMRVPTDRGCLWFKATTPALAHESALTEALCSCAPGRTPEVLAADAARNWLLLADGGTRLRALPQKERGPDRAAEVGQVYGRLQRDVAVYLDEMRALGTPDCRLAALPGLYAGLLEERRLLGIGAPEGLTAEEHVRLLRLVPSVAEIAAELATFGVPETIQHDDLHWNNVMVREGRLLIFDWGDSTVSHPFLSLVVLLRGTARDLGVEPDSAPVLAVRDAYLDAWNLPLTRPERERACRLADALGRISRALNYARLLPGLDEPHRTELRPNIAGWLQDLLESPALVP